MWRCVGSLLLAVSMASGLWGADDVPRKPNIVFIIADDLGYGDLGCYGQKRIQTPHLDALAAEGMRFTQCYAGGSSCTPSRCVLMTGLHTGHCRLRANSKLPLLPDDTTIAQILKQAGYATGGFGKWSLGDANTTGAPWKKGFDLFVGYLDQSRAHGYYPEYLDRNDKRLELTANRNGNRHTYSHDVIADAALDFIREHHDRPFFAYIPFTIPHAEVTVPEDSLVEYQGKWPEPKPFAGGGSYCPQDQPRAVRAAMISRMDRDIGRIVDLLEELHLSENTLIIFTSDNGPTSAGGQDPEFFQSAGPLRGLKFSLYEGGIRVPMIARWPGKIVGGTTSTRLTDFADVFPTLAELAGVAPPAGLDGVSIAPTLLGQPDRQAKRDVFYWEVAPMQALRQGDWKLLRHDRNKPPELYNLASDESETTDVAKQYPEVVARLEQLMTESRVDSAEFPLDKVAKKGPRKR